MQVMTVTGPIPAEELGITSVHEHIMADCSFSGDDPTKKFDDPELMAEEMAYFIAAGGKTMVELTSNGLGHDPLALRDISRKSGLQIVASTGFYREIRYPDYVLTETADQLAKRMVDEARNGIDGTDVKPGIIAELAAEFPEEKLSANEEKVFQAGARASLETGFAISTHCWAGEAATDMIRVVVDDEGVTPNRLVIGHLGVPGSPLDRVIRIADRGVYLGVDAIGYNWETYNDVDRAKLVNELIDRGYLNQVTISLDMMRDYFLHKFGGHGYDFLLNGFVPLLKEQGVTDEQVHVMLVDTPRRLLTGEAS